MKKSITVSIMLLAFTNAWASSLNLRAARALGLRVGEEVAVGLIDGIVSCPNTLELKVSNNRIQLHDGKFLDLTDRKVKIKKGSIKGYFMYSEYIPASVLVSKTHDGFELLQVDRISPNGFKCIYK